VKEMDTRGKKINYSEKYSVTIEEKKNQSKLSGFLDKIKNTEPRRDESRERS
jgi:hypothetical protein